MKQILEFTADPYQTAQIPLEDTNGTASITLYWAPTQQSWYFDISYNNIVSNGNKLCLGPNILRCFSSLLPFGLMVVGSNLLEPYKIDDFVTQRVRVFVLNSTEVKQFERLVYNE